MNATQAVVSTPAEAQGVDAADLLKRWVELCNDFRRRERREIIEQGPSAQELARYRENLKWMIRSARALLNIASDPEFPARQKYAPEIAGKLLQLEESWECLNNPMTEAEADAFLQKHFPDEPKAGSTA